MPKKNTSAAGKENGEAKSSPSLYSLFIDQVKITLPSFGTLKAYSHEPFAVCMVCGELAWNSFTKCGHNSEELYKRVIPLQMLLTDTQLKQLKKELKAAKISFTLYKLDLIDKETFSKDIEVKEEILKTHI